MDPDNPRITLRTLCVKIHGLSAQSVDPCFVQHNVRRNKLKAKDKIAESDYCQPRKAMLRIRNFD